MTASSFPTEVAYFQETTFGTGPADAAAWVSNGTRIRVNRPSISADGFVTTMIDDLRSQERVMALNDKVYGIENPEFGLQIPFAGAEVSTADNTQVAATAYSNILAHAIGAQSRTYRASALGTHSATTVELDDATGYDEGTFCAVEDADDTGKLYIRRVTGLAGTTLTLDEALPFTPADGDVVWPCIAIHFNEANQVDSGAGPYTFSWLLQMGGAASGEYFEANGCKSFVSAINIVRNELASIDLQTLGAGLQHPTELSEPSWSATPSGNAGVPIGASCKGWLQDYGTTTQNAIHINELTIEPGLPAVRIPTVTSASGGTQGTALYSTQPTDTLITLNIVPWATTMWTDFIAGTKKVFRYAKVAGPGQCIAVHASRCEIVENPMRGEAEAVSSTRVTLRCHEDTDNASASDAELWKSKLILVMA